MALSVNNNTAAFNTYRALSTTQSQLNSSLEKLSSGFRINRAADDAAGLSISEGLRSKISGLGQSVRNAQDGVSILQTAEGALNETTSILQRMRTLTVQAQNSGTYGNSTTSAVKAIQSEVDQLAKELDRISSKTEFNGTKLLDNSYAGKTFQIGVNAGDTLTITISSSSTAAAAFTSTALGVNGGTGTNETSTGLDVSASATLTALDSALTSVSSARGNLGAIQNRLEHTINNLNVGIENLTASESRIRDTDMAQEMVNFTSKQILQQAGTSMLGQAKSLPQSVLSLLQG